MEEESAWGTWEELLLAGAVLRHGTQAWGAVASELRARSLFPFSFTPEACKAKYEDLRQQYIGCTALFEDLKKRRVEELRRELEKSDDSIGSLESKLENLKAEKDVYSHIDRSSSQIDSPTPVVKSEGLETVGKDSSKDGLSAGSFTHDIRKTTTETDLKPDISDFSDHDKVLKVCKRADTSSNKEGSLKKKRGKRKRTDCTGESKEASIGESENLGSANVASSTMRSSSLKDINKASSVMGNDYLMGVFNSVAENEVALVFRRKLDSQKRARYRKIIRRHVDFDTLRSRITNSTITSVKELFRDLLLLANNALVFYSKRTREYKTALLLRDIVTKSYKKHCRGTTIKTLPSPFSPLPVLCNLPVKPRSIRPHPCKFKLSLKLPAYNADNSVDGASKRSEKPTHDDNPISRTREVSKSASNNHQKPSTEALIVTKKRFNKMGKVGCGPNNRQGGASVKDKKRVRRR